MKDQESIVKEVYLLMDTRIKEKDMNGKGILECKKNGVRSRIW